MEQNQKLNLKGYLEIENQPNNCFENCSFELKGSMNVKPSNMGMVRNEKLWFTIKEMLSRINPCLLCLGLVILFCVMGECLYLIHKEPIIHIDVDSFLNKLTNYYPKIVSFAIALYAFLIGIKGDVLRRMLINAGEKTPYKEFCATAIFFTIISILVIIVAEFLLITKDCLILWCILQGLVCYSIIILFHILLHMYTASTFFVNKS